MSLTTLRGSNTYMWDTSKTLGQGATSKVYKGRNKLNGEEVAVKVFSSAGQMRPIDVQIREYAVMRKLKHQNVVGLLAIEEEQGTYNKVIVMELSTSGSLYSILDEPKNAFGLEESEFLLVVKNVVDGIRYLREQGIVHRDIKPGNILCYREEDGRNVYKLTDFGAARELMHEDEQFMSLYGTEEYLHPDIYGKAVMRDSGIGAFDATVDLWSLGVTFYQTATGQLPFRPFGGRKNKATMYEITKSKDPGVISGVQRTERGKIEWSKELPSSCKLSGGLKSLVTPLLAGLLEMNDKRKWSFDMMFRKVDTIKRKSVVNVFCATTWMSIRIYIDGNEKFSKFQDLIAEQFDIAACEQLLLFEGDLLFNVVDSLKPIREYPRSISESNPVFVFMKHYHDQKKFLPPVILEFPKFGTQMNVGNDYQLAKLCCSIIYFYLWSVKRFHLKEFLVKESVHKYMHELRHECSHLYSYLQHIRDHCKTTLKWKNSLVKNNGLFKEILSKSKVPKPEHEIPDFPTKILNISEEIEGCLSEVETRLRHLDQDENTDLSLMSLERSWADNLGCKDRDYRCAERIEMMIESLEKIVKHFKEHRQATFIDEYEKQVHTFEKNQLQEICSKTQSLLISCNKEAEEQHLCFQTWYSKAVETREKSDEIDQSLAELEKKQKEFVKELHKYAENINEKMHRTVELNLSGNGTGATHTTISKNKSAPSSLSVSQQSIVQQINDGLQESSMSLQKLGNDVRKNNNLLQSMKDLMEDTTIEKME